MNREGFICLCNKQLKPFPTFRKSLFWRCPEKQQHHFQGKKTKFSLIYIWKASHITTIVELQQCKRLLWIRSSQNGCRVHLMTVRFKMKIPRSRLTVMRLNNYCLINGIIPTKR